MKRYLVLVAVVFAAAWASTSVLNAAEPAVCHCGRVHSASEGHANGGYSNGYNNNSNSGLPRGRRYFNGRYFGNFNNRYYGPQYGYF